LEIEAARCFSEVHYERLFVVELFPEVERDASCPAAAAGAARPARAENADPTAAAVLSLLGVSASARRRQALRFVQPEHLVGLGVRSRVLMARAVILDIGGILIEGLLREVASENSYEKWILPPPC